MTLLRLYTDFVCPFCFIAEESTVPRLVAELDLTLEWHGFELHPETPRGGMPLTELFRGAHLPSLHARTKAFGAQFGVRDFDPPDRLRNTRRALAMAEYARDHGVLEAFRKAAFDAHWRRGKDLEADADLREIAESVGLPAGAALRAADDRVMLERVDARQAAARKSGVSGIPTFDFENVRVSGCQPLEVLAEAARRAGAKPRLGT
jgi:predicted DsbA family dithiol-disulfide isomerase